MLEWNDLTEKKENQQFSIKHRNIINNNVYLEATTSSPTYHWCIPVTSEMTLADQYDSSNFLFSYIAAAMGERVPCWEFVDADLENVFLWSVAVDFFSPGCSISPCWAYKPLRRDR